MTDLVVATPVFLDLTFVGLESLPGLGEERFAAELLRSPGGGAITAVAAARLGLSVAVAAPLADDVAGELVRDLLAGENVSVVSTRSAPRTPTTAVLPVGGDRAMITVDPGVRAARSDVAAQDPRAVAASLDQLHLASAGAALYVTCGEDDARAFAGRPPQELADAHVFFASRSEALALTGATTVEAAASQLAGLADTVVVTLAADGAIACHADEIVRAAAERVERPVDTTGAGDLLVAAFIWADLGGASLADRLRWGVLYASLAITAPTGVGGALREAELLEAGLARGLTAPPQATVP